MFAYIYMHVLLHVYELFWLNDKLVMNKPFKEIERKHGGIELYQGQLKLCQKLHIVLVVFMQYASILDSVWKLSRCPVTIKFHTKDGWENLCGTCRWLSFGGNHIATCDRVTIIS
jgi:hypothetical protein